MSPRAARLAGTPPLRYHQDIDTASGLAAPPPGGGGPGGVRQPVLGSVAPPSGTVNATGLNHAASELAARSRALITDLEDFLMAVDGITVKEEPTQAPVPPSTVKKRKRRKKGSRSQTSSVNVAAPQTPPQQSNVPPPVIYQPTVQQPGPSAPQPAAPPRQQQQRNCLLYTSPSPRD